MSVGLDPIVSRKLDQFRRRRFWLIFSRGLSVGIVSFLACVTVVAFIDWYWLLSDSTRWGLGISVYLFSFLAVWITSLRRMMHIPAREEIATQMEQTDPQLRENLLSAVELATDDPTGLHDSPMFRGLLQGNVARQMGQIRVPQMLPVKLVAKWLFAALVLVAVAATLLLNGDMRLRQLVTRAALPGANIARVSRIHVNILEPTPHSLLLAEDETVAIVVEVTGGSVNEVTLETITPSQGTVRQPMRGTSGEQFAANLHVTDESVEYRIFAGDAVTQKYRIESRPRPRVNVFHKTFQYPDYSQLPRETSHEAHGDLQVLEGTQVELIIEVDQPVSKAELRLDLSESDEVKVIPLSPVESKESSAQGEYLQWAATVPVDEAAIYKVNLVSKETGFDNVFSPKYEIRPIPDLIPKVGFVEQQETTLLLPPNDILALKGIAADDLPLVGLEQQISVNGQDWVSIPLEMQTERGASTRLVTSEWQWDLLQHQLKTGDQILTKLVATDLKGNFGESIPLRIVVAGQDFDPKRHEFMETKIELYDSLADFAALVAEQKVSALEAIERLRQPEQEEQQALLDRTLLLDLSAKQRDTAGKVLEEVLTVEKSMPIGADAYDLELSGSLLSRIYREYSNAPAYLLRAIESTDDDKLLKRDFDELKRTYERVTDDAKVVASHYQNMASHNLLVAIAMDMEALLHQQKVVVQGATQSWERLTRQETIVLHQLEQLERLIRKHRGRISESLDSRLLSQLNWSEGQRHKLEDALESEDKLEQLKKTSQDLLNQLASRQRIDQLDGGLPSRLGSVRRDLDSRSGHLYSPIEQLANALRQQAQLLRQSQNSADSNKSNEFLRQSQRYEAEINLKLRHSLDQLRDRRDLTQSRIDADSQYAADSSLTHRAVTSLFNISQQGQLTDSEVPAHLAEIFPAYRILEAGHQLILVQKSVTQLHNRERWETDRSQAYFDHPRQWDVLFGLFDIASRRLREAKVPTEITTRFDQMRWSASVRDAARKIGERRWNRDKIVGANHELGELQREIDFLVVELEPIMAQARAVIANYTPTIPQMAEQSAQQLRNLEGKTTQAAESAEKNETSEQTPQLAEIQQLQESINQQLDDLSQALIEDANSQDLLDEQQRERARDADDSIAMIQEPARKMNRALEQAQAAKTGEKQASDLARATEEQEKTAQALDLVAKHFGKLEEGLDIADSREQLRQAEREMGIAGQMDQQYQNAQQLGEMAQQSPEALLAELERELQQNPAMQQALSEITEKTLNEAQSALEFAARDDENIQKANERSDSQFQAKKKELAAGLRQVGSEASQLSRQLLAQANQSAAQGKSTEAQKKLAETQQKLNEIATIANSARDDQLLEDLQQTAQEAKSALQEATKSLKQAKQETAAKKDEQIHADDKSREAQKKDSEQRRQRFHDQQKRTAQDLAKRADDAKRRADQTVKNAQNQVNSAEKKVQQAEKNLARKPDDSGLKNKLNQEEARKLAEQKKLDAAKQAQTQAAEVSQELRKASDEINSKKLPPLNAQNPATQLADLYTEEALQVAEKLNQQSEELAKASEFQDELAPTQRQLASSEQQQQELTKDVNKVAEDVSRAARHERRLKNLNAVEPLQSLADSIQQVATKESTEAQQRLGQAQSEAESREASEATQGTNPAEANKQQGQNDMALQAQQAVAKTEKSLLDQAEQLSKALEPILAADENAQANAENPQGGQADQQSATSPSSGTSQSKPTAQQQAESQRLAQTLDELDRQLANASSSESADGANPQVAQTLDSISQAARTQQAQLAKTRTQSQQQAQLASSDSATESADVPSETGVMTDFSVQAINRTEDKKWGMLRNQSADDLAKGQSEVVSEEYRKSVEAYFRVLAERARKKK